MGKASSSKKVARAAKAGGRARSAGERNFLFPSALAVVVILGTLLVVYARDNRSAEALEAPLVGDHWHAAYGFYVCDDFLPDLPEFVAPQNGGNHTHGDGLIHIHPFATSRSGEKATLQNWMKDAGEVLGGGDGIRDDELGIPTDETFVEGESDCDGVDGDPIVQVAVWDSAATALAGDDADRVITSDFDDIRFLSDGQAFTIAFAPEGADIPPPASISGLQGVGSDLGVPADEVPDDVPLPGAEGDAGDEGTTDTSEPTDDAGEGSTDDSTTTTAGDQ